MMTPTLLLLAGLAFGQQTATQDEPDYRRTRPPEVEEGAVRTVYVVKDGDTIDSIASTLGFLPDEIKTWNRVQSVKPGDEIIVWAAPMAQPEPEPEPVAPEPEPEPAKKKKAKGGDGGSGDKDGIGGFVGLQVGPAFSLNPLGTAITPRLELGIELPPMDRSWRLFVSGQYLRPVTTGNASDDRVPGGTFSYELKQDELSIAFGPQFRAGMLESKVKPEVSVGPSVFLYRSTVNGEAGGAAFPESTEQYTRVGIYAAGGIEWELGPGELTLLLSFESSGLNGVITGEAVSASLSPLLGYRLVF